MELARGAQGVTEALEGEPGTLAQILGKALAAYRAAEAAKKARELVSAGCPDPHHCLCWYTISPTRAQQLLAPSCTEEGYTLCSRTL